MGLKTFTIDFKTISQDKYLRNDTKYHGFLASAGWNFLKAKNRHLVALREILEDDYVLFNYEENKVYKGIPTGQNYVDEEGVIKNFQLITKESHPGRLKYKISSQNIIISSLKLAKAPAFMVKNIDVSEYVFSNGFYIFKVKKAWNKTFILYVLRTKKLKNILDNSIYRGIGISSYRKEDLMSIKIPFIPKTQQDQIVAEIQPIEAKIKILKKA